MPTATTTFSRTDEKVRDAVLFQLDWEPDFNASGVGVAVEDGVVTLTGYVESYAAKLAAERAAKRVYGVRGLANDIQVKLFDERNDTDIAHDCVQALRSRITVPPEVKVTVRYGHAMLEGTVGWMYQKIAAENAVKYVRGVKGVANEITLKPSASATDVKEKIEGADSSLRRHRCAPDRRRGRGWPHHADGQRPFLGGEGGSRPRGVGRAGRHDGRQPDRGTPIADCGKAQSAMPKVKCRMPKQAFGISFSAAFALSAFALSAFGLRHSPFGVRPSPRVQLERPPPIPRRVPRGRIARSDRRASSA